MPKQTLEYLKTRFEQGDKPTAQDFIDLIDTLEDAVALESHTTSTTVAHGGIVASDDVRLINARPPLAHEHVEYVTTTDERLSDSRTPLPHDHNSEYYTKQESDSNFLKEIKTINGQNLIGQGDILIEGGSSGIVPPGTIIRGGDICPEGYFHCNGSLLNKNSYPELYSAIGDSYAYLSNQYDNGNPWVNQNKSNDTSYSKNTWSLSSIAQPEALTKSNVFVTKGFVYLVGGKVSSTYKDTIYRAVINLDGTIQPFELYGTLPATLGAGTATPILIKNYVYLFCNYVNASASVNYYRATIYEDGSISNFSVAGQINNAWTGGCAVVTKDRVLILGCDSSSSTAIAPINSDGTLGTWVSGPGSGTTSYTNGVCFSLNDRVYFIGGYGTSTSTYLDIYADGTVGPWTKGVTLVGTVGANSVFVVTHNNVYILRVSSSLFITMPINTDGTLDPGFIESNTCVSQSNINGYRAFVTSSKIYLLRGGTTEIYESDFQGGSNDYLQESFTQPELNDGFFIPDMREEDELYPNNSVKYYIKY